MKQEIEGEKFGLKDLCSGIADTIRDQWDDLGNWSVLAGYAGYEGFTKDKTNYIVMCLYNIEDLENTSLPTILVSLDRNKKSSGGGVHDGLLGGGGGGGLFDQTEEDDYIDDGGAGGLEGEVEVVVNQNDDENDSDY